MPTFYPLQPDYLEKLNALDTAAAGLAADVAAAAGSAADALASANTAAAIVTGGTASLTPTAGLIPLADGAGKIAAGWLGGAASFTTLSATSQISSSVSSGYAALFNGGNVGIGTTNPGALLSLGNSSNQNTGKLLIYDDGTYIAGLGQYTNEFRMFADSWSKVMTFGSQTRAGVFTEGMRLSSGNVGIGTTDPGAYKLNVNGNTNITGTAIDFVTSGTVLTVGTGVNNGTVSAGVFTDRTKAYTGDALSEFAKIAHVDGEIDHTTLPTFVQVELIKPIHEDREVLKPVYETQKVTATKDVDGVPTEYEKDVQVQVGEKTVIESVKVGEETVVERDIGAMISMLTVAVQQLTTRIEKLETP